MKESERLATIAKIADAIHICNHALSKQHRELFNKIIVPELEKYVKILIPLAYKEAQTIIENGLRTASDTDSG